MKKLEISGKILAHNTLLNFIGRAVPFIVAIIAIPFIIRGLGEERFGLLSIMWVVLGYFTIFDLGLGRATTKYVAEALGDGQTEKVSNIIWTAVTVQALLGIAGTILIFYGTPLLVERILNITPSLISEAKSAFHVLAFSIPVLLISSSFSGALEAAQRFDLINAVKIPSSALTYFLPLVGLFFNFTLSGIVALILVARIATLITFAALNLHITPQMRHYSNSLSLFLHLLRFGGWVTVSNIIGPVLQYLDRFLIGSLLSVSIVAYYTAPFDAVSRLWIIPLSLVMTIFPAFSTLGLNRLDNLKYYFIRATKYTFLTVSFIVPIIILFAHDILTIWLGATFAQMGTFVLQILSLGVLVSSLTHLALALFQGIGRPEITAKIQLVLLPFTVLLSILLISKLGIVGAAISWTISRTAGLLLSWRYVWKIIRLDKASLVRSRILHEFVWFLAFASLLMLLLIPNSIFIKILGASIVCFIFIMIGWRYVLNNQDRIAVRTYTNKLVSRIYTGRHVGGE